MNLAQRIDTFLKGKHSPLAGHGQSFVAAGQKYGFDPLLLVAIAGAESSFATTKLSGPHNPFGWGPGHGFNSFDQAIDVVGSGLRKGYLSQGLKTISAIGNKWAPVGASNDPTGLNNNWTRNVTRIYGDLGGSGIGAGTGGGSAPTPPSIPTGSDLPPPDFSGLAGSAFQSLGETAIRRHADPIKALSTLAFAVASGPSLPAPQEKTQPSVEIQGKTTPRDKAAVTLVQKYLGTPYVWGGEKPGGFDCSGLLQYVWAQQGVKIPRVTYDQWKTGTAVGRNQLRPGDAVFFHMGKNGPEHVGMYIGGGKFIEAPHTGAQVRISKLAGRKDFVGGRRWA